LLLKLIKPGKPGGMQDEASGPRPLKN